MSRSHIAFFLLLVATAVQAEAPLTWQQANHRSAELIRSNGSKMEAADYAHIAFDLYGKDNKAYSPASHAQLLLNAVDARIKDGQLAAAINELDRGIVAISEITQGSDPVLISLYLEGTRISIDHSASERYFTRASALAQKVWGADDPRAIDVDVTWTQWQYAWHDNEWARSRLRATRERAAKAPEQNSIALARIDLGLAELEDREKHYEAAKTLYRDLIARLAAANQPEMTVPLKVAKGRLLSVCRQTRDTEATQALEKAFAEDYRLDVTPRFVHRVQPRYPERALRESITGYVLMEVTFAKDGTVNDIQVIDAAPGNVFVGTSLEAVREWKLAPSDGAPRERKALQELEFVLAH